MPPLRVFAPLGVAAAAMVGLIGLVVAPAATSSGGAVIEQDNYRDPPATASGGAVGTPTYPSIVNTRLVRAQAALTSATALADQGQGANAVADLNAATANMTAAWNGAEYVIKTAPPPPPPAGAGGSAHSSGGAIPGASPYAAPEDTAFAVLSLQHDVVTTSLGLYGSGNAALDNALSASIRAAVDARDAAVEYIHKIPPPPPPPAGVGGSAHSSGGAIGSTWATIMPTLNPLLDDEIQANKGTRAASAPGALTPAVRTFLRQMTARDNKTKTTITTYWPPVVGDG
jgi:hypothetical protein